MKRFKKNSYFISMRDGFASKFNEFFSRPHTEENSVKITNWIVNRLEQARQSGADTLKEDFTLATMLNGQRILLRNYIQREEFDKIIFVLKTFIATERPEIISLELNTLTEAIQDKTQLCQEDKTLSFSLREIIQSIFDNTLTKEELSPVYNLLGSDSEPYTVQDNVQLDS